MLYELMRKNDPFAVAEFSEEGDMTHCSDLLDRDLAPLEYQSYSDWLSRWWTNRSVPLSQEHLASFLQEHGFLSPNQYLVKNLGLSLTDYYWVRPVGSNLRWEDVNLFDHSFTGHFLHDNKMEMDNISTYTPNSSLQGELEKTWAIDTDGTRVLIKGNRNQYSTESINEIIACSVHNRQGYDNFAHYKLVHIEGKAYDYGCASRLFTDQKHEFLSGEKA